MFQNFIMLAGIGGAAVPLVLHLMSRARFQSLDWGAMMFLPQADVRQRRGIRVKEWILLLLRMAMVSLLAVALARPILRGSWAGLTQEGRVTAAIVLDCSASMSYESNGRKRFDLAREAVLQILSNLRKGDRVSLVLMGQGDAKVQEPSSDLQAVASFLMELKPMGGRADIGAALIQAADLLERHAKDNHELFVICDRQASNWRNINAPFRSAWAERMKTAGADLLFSVIPIGGEETDNVGVESIELLNPPAIARQGGEAEVRLRNYGMIPCTDLPLGIQDGQPQPQRMNVNLPAGGRLSVRVPVKFDTPGPQLLSASIRSAGETLDDHYDYALEVIEPLKVLILSGDKPLGTFQGGTDFLKVSLAPYQAVKRSGPNLAEVTVLPAEDWANADFDQYKVVVMVNVGRPNSRLVRELEQYVWGGGGLLLVPGNLCRYETWNSQLYREGAGILPAQLSAPTPGDGSAATTLLGMDLAHPIFRFLAGRPDPIPSATVGRFFPAAPRQPDGQVLASYASGQPFLIEAPWGRGRVLLTTTSLGSDWSTLPLSNFYLPFVQSAIRYLSVTSLSDRNLSPGEPLTEYLEDVPPGGKVTLVVPSGRAIELDVLRLGSRGQVHYEQTQEPGFYTLRYVLGKTEKTVHYVVHSDREESDLSPLTAQQFQQYRQMLGFELVAANPEAITTFLEKPRLSQELWPPALGAVLAMAMVEMWLGRRWFTES